MKKILIIVSVMILQSCTSSISDKNCIIKESSSTLDTKEKYKYCLYCNIGAVFLYSDSLYKVGDTLKILK